MQPLQESGARQLETHQTYRSRFALAALPAGDAGRLLPWARIIKRPETKVPETWNGQEVVTPATPSKTTTNPAALVAWWNAFKDPTLSSLVEMAIRANLDLRQAEARIRQARAALGVAGAPLYPEMDATALYQRSSRSSQSGGPAAAAPAAP